jgi:MFS family permease
VFQTYYEEQAAWHQSPSDIAWIGSIQAFLLLLVGAVSGPLYDAGYFRCLIVTGTVLIPLGFFMTSICTTYWQTLLAQGVCIGLGNGCLFVPGLAILPQYFTTKNALATGIAATGTSVGGIVLPIVWTNLVEQVGFAWATRALGFITLAALVTSLAVMKPRLTPKARRRLFDLSALKELPYLFYSVGSFFAFVGYIVPTVYLEAFAIETGITGQSFGFYLLAIMNGASIAGRVIPTIFAFYFGPLNSMAVIEILAGGLTFAWIAITTSLPGTIIYAVLYGFLSGGFAALLPVGVFTLTPDLRTMGTRMGQVMFIGAFGVLIGAPVSGAIQTSAASWVGLKSFAGGVMVLAAGFWVCARVAKSGWSLRTRA